MEEGYYIISTYVIARTPSKRPTLQHILRGYRGETECGLDTTRWSRAYQAEPIKQILCRKCAARAERPSLGTERNHQ